MAHQEQSNKMTETLTAILSIFSGFGSLGIIAIVSVATHRGKLRFDKLDFKITEVDTDNKIEHEILKKQITDISDNYSVEKTIRKLTRDYEDFIDTHDIPKLKLMKACADVSVYFYNEMMVRPLSRNTMEDLDRCGERAVAIVQSAAGRFDKPLYDKFWPEFEKNAIDVRDEFLDIFQSKFNDKENEFIESILRYLRKQYKLIINLRR